MTVKPRSHLMFASIAGVQLRRGVPPSDRGRGHHQLPHRGGNKRQRRNPDSRQPQQLQLNHFHARWPTRFGPGVESETRPMLRRRPHGRRFRSFGEQRLPSLHLPLRPSAPHRSVKRRGHAQGGPVISAAVGTSLLMHF